MSLPKGWATARLGDVVVERVSQGEPTGRTVKYIDIGAIDRERKSISETQLVTASTAPTRARQWVNAGDVLVSMTRPNLNAVAQVPEALGGAVASTGFDVLRAVGVLPEWIYYRVRSRAFVQDVCSDVQGVVYPAIRPADVRRHELPIPPREEQARIVESLESQLSRLDAAVASLENAQANLRAYRASVLKAAVEGRLVPTEAELARKEGRSYEPADVLLERIRNGHRRRWQEGELAKLRAAGKAPKDDRWKARYREPALGKARDLPSLPSGWCWTTLGAVAPLQAGYAFPSGGFARTGVRLLKGNNVRDGWIADEQIDHWPKSQALRFGAYRLQAGDVVLAMDRPVYSSGSRATKVAQLGPSWAGALLLQRVGRFLSSDGVDGRFLFQFVSSQYFRSHIVREQNGSQDGKDLPHVSAQTVDSCLFPLPPLPEQTRIADESERLLSCSSQAEETVIKELVRCKRLRQAILGLAFEGRLVDQDPDNEPAGALLTRIRSERNNASLGTPKAKRARQPRAAS